MTDKNETGQFDEEEIIELTSTASEPPGADEESIEPAETSAETSSADEPAPESGETSEIPGISIMDDDDDMDAFDDNFEGDMDLPPDDDDDFVESMGMEVVSESTEEETVSDFQEDTAEETADAGPVSITPEQMEAALERVVKNLYAEKIESILVDVVKKTITREIDRLKGTLLEELKGDD